MVPALLYGFQLWGMHTPTGEAMAAMADLQSIYDRFLRRICGLSMRLGLYCWKNWLCHLCKSLGGKTL